MIKYINDVPGAPKAIGPYSQATIYNHIAFLSGQIPLDPTSGEIVQGGIEAQTEQVLKNIKAILTHLKLDFSNVIETDIYLTDLKHFQIVNGLYEKALGANKPARATVQVAALPKGAIVEIRMKAGTEK